MVVAKRIITGKDEKSIGDALLIATMIIKRAITMLKVNKMSNMKGGIGSTSRANTSSTAPGIASAPNSKLRIKRRKSDKRISANSTLSISRQFLDKT